MWGERSTAGGSTVRGSKGSDGGARQQRKVVRSGGEGHRERDLDTHGSYEDRGKGRRRDLRAERRGVCAVLEAIQNGLVDAPQVPLERQVAVGVEERVARVVVRGVEAWRGRSVRGGARVVRAEVWRGGSARERET